MHMFTLLVQLAGGGGAASVPHGTFCTNSVHVYVFTCDSARDSAAESSASSSATTHRDGRRQRAGAVHRRERHVLVAPRVLSHRADLREALVPQRQRPLMVY